MRTTSSRDAIRRWSRLLILDRSGIGLRKSVCVPSQAVSPREESRGRSVQSEDAPGAFASCQSLRRKSRPKSDVSLDLAGSRGGKSQRHRPIRSGKHDRLTDLVKVDERLLEPDAEQPLALRGLAPVEEAEQTAVLAAKVVWVRQQVERRQG